MPSEFDKSIGFTSNFDASVRPQRSAGSRRAERAARTEVRRGTRKVKRLGLESELKPEQTTLDTVFDLLQIGQFTTAGLAQEFQAGGDLGDLFARAGTEFLNALPFISEENAEFVTGKTPTRPSFTQVLKNEGVGNEWAAATAGFVLDVALDPTTYFGGFLLRGGARQLAKGGKFLSSNSAAVRSGVEIGEKTLAPVKELLGKAFVPSFEIDQLVKSGELTQEGADVYRAAKQAERFAKEQGFEDVRDRVVRISANLDEGESRMMSEFFDQGDDKLRVQLTTGMPKAQADEVMERVGEFRKFYQDDFQKGFDAELLDETQVRNNYLPGRSPQTPTSQRAWEKLVAERGIAERAPEGALRGPSGDAGLGQRLGLRGAAFQKSKVFDHLEERIVAGVATETDMAVLAATRGFETVRKIASKNFGDAVLKNGDISQRILPHELSSLNSQEMLTAFSDKGRVPFNATKMQIIGKPTQVAKGDAVYMMPRVIAKDLAISDNVFKDPTVATEMFEGFKEWQNLWKGYAVLSPGFHGRNMFSNWFNNWVAGVVNPKHYTDALALQRGAFKGKIFGVEADAFRLEMQELGVTNRGIIAGDIGEEIEKSLLRDVQGSLFDKTVGQASPQLRWNRAAGRAIENNGRIAHYISKRKEGMNAAEAAASVKQYLFDYQELTEFERNVMKSVLPFYTWMRKNIPLQAHALINNAGDAGKFLKEGNVRGAAKDVFTQYRNVPKLFGALESISADWKQVPTPDYFQEIHAARLPIEGEPGVANVFGNPNLPFQDLNRLNWRDIVSSVTPIARVPIELSVGKLGHSFFLDRPIERFPGEQGVTGLPRKAEFAVEGLAPPVGKGIRLFRNFQNNNLKAPLISEATGIKTITLDPGRAQTADTFSRRAKVREILQRERNNGRLR